MTNQVGTSIYEAYNENMMMAVRGHSRVTSMNQVVGELFLAGRSLMIVMLLARNTGCAHQGDHRRFSFLSQCCGWTRPCGSYCDYKMHLKNNHQGIFKKKGGGLITYKAWGEIWHRAHPVRF